MILSLVLGNGDGSSKRERERERERGVYVLHTTPHVIANLAELHVSECDFVHEHSYSDQSTTYN